MTPKHVVINLGMPRSGTTLVQKMLERGHGYFHQKLCEYHPWHPMNGPDLIRLVNTFRWKTVLIVRTSRPFDDVRASMDMGVKMGNPHRWGRDEVRELYRTEQANFARLAEHPEGLDESVRLRTLSFEYDELGDIGSRGELLRRLANRLPRVEANLANWHAYLTEVWGKDPVNVGRLARELGFTRESLR